MFQGGQDLCQEAFFSACPFEALSKKGKAFEGLRQEAIVLQHGAYPGSEFEGDGRSTPYQENCVIEIDARTTDEIAQRGKASVSLVVFRPRGLPISEAALDVAFKPL